MENEAEKQAREAADAGKGDIGSQELGGSEDQAPTTPAPQNQSLSDSSTISTQAAPTQAGQKSSSGQRFSNLKKLVARNSDSKIGSSIGSNINRDSSKVSAGVDKANKLFQDKSAAESSRLDTAESVSKDENTYGAGAADIHGDTQKMADFLSYTKGTESVADLSIQNQNNIKNDVSNLQQRGANLGTEKGRFSELKKTFGRGRDYTTGQSRTDQLLLQSNKNEMSNLRNMQNTVGKDEGNRFINLMDRSKKTQGLVNQRATDVQSDIQNKLYGNGTEDNQGFLKSVSSDYRQQLADANARGLNEKQDVLAGLKNGQISAAQAEQLGLTAADLKNTFGVDAGNFLTEANVDQNRVLNKDEVNRWNALRAMGGIEGSANADYLGDKLTAEKAVDEQGAYGGQKEFIDAVNAAKVEYTGQRGTLDSALSGAEQAKRNALIQGYKLDLIRNTTGENAPYNPEDYINLANNGAFSSVQHILGSSEKLDSDTINNLNNLITDDEREKMIYHGYTGNDEIAKYKNQQKIANQKKSDIDALLAKYGGGANSGLKIG